MHHSFDMLTTFLPPFLHQNARAMVVALLVLNNALAEETPLEFTSKPIVYKDEGAAAMVEPGSTPDSLLLKYDFTNGGEFVQFQLPIIPLDERFSRLEITLKGSEEIISFNVRGADKQAIGTRIGPLTGEEETIIFDLKKIAEEGANKDKNFVYPVTIIGFMLRAPKEARGSIEIIKVIAKTN